MNHLEKRKQAEELLSFATTNLSNLCFALRRTGNVALADSIGEEIDDIIKANQLFTEAHQELFNEWFNSVEEGFANTVEAALTAAGLFRAE